MGTPYFRLLDNVDLPGRWFLKSPLTDEGEEVDERQFTEGRVVPVNATLMLPVRRPGRPLDFTFADSDVPVVRREVADLLSQLAGPDLQRVPVCIEEQADAFEILNVVRVEDCIDRERSEMTLWGQGDGRPDKVGKPRMITALRVDASRAGGAPIFRLADWRIALVVSDAIRRALLEAEVTGVQFGDV
jgi:hypothetical protein